MNQILNFTICILTFLTIFSQSYGQIQYGDSLNNGGLVDLNYDGKTIAVGPMLGNGYLRVYDVIGNNRLQRGSDISIISESSISLSRDGNTVVVGEPLATNGGDVKVYYWDGANWIQKGQTLNLLTGSYMFGYKVKVNYDGSTFIVGIPNYQSLGLGISKVYEWNGTSWFQKGSDLVGTDHEFGRGVSMNFSGNRVAVGSIQTDGMANIYEWNGNSWIQMGPTLLGFTGSAFGGSLSFNGTGSTIGIGAYGDFNGTIYGAGSVSVYDWNGSNWILRGKSIKGEYQSTNLGDGVSLSEDGNMLVVGGSGYSGGKGKSIVYQWNNSEWIQTLEIFGKILNQNYGINGSISSNGKYFAAGSIYTSYFYQLRGISGFIYNDFITNCQKDTTESTILTHKKVIIQPGNIITNIRNGFWFLDSLPLGSYTAQVDTTGNWNAVCSPIVNFDVLKIDTMTSSPPLAMRNINPCVDSDISIAMPTIRRCLSNQILYVSASNSFETSTPLNAAYAIIQLDSFLTINSSTKPYTSLGNYQYKFNLGTLNPGVSVNWQISTTVSCNAILGQTLCIQANLFPVAPCVLDSTPTGTGCLGPWDNSFLRVTGLCDTDSIRFEIRNLGSGDMDCFRDIRLFIDGQFFSLDSIKLLSGEVYKIAILGDARTWRLEADQHPLVPGNSHPNATVELCGDSLLQSQNWTSNKVNILPMDDADPVVDIYCGLVSGSYDPNDKTGYPLGVDFGHYILPNQQMQYVIRFQNTGTDTAFKVVIRDTLETDLNIFSVVSGVSSHNYSFRMYGPRILEWTFNNIMLPDSFNSEPNSHGFVTFIVEQNENLPSGTSIDNSAAIYFDFNAPIITNTYHHEIKRELLTTGFDAKDVAKGDVLVYPNPNNGLFMMELPSSMPSTPLRQQNCKITICNVMGQVVYISTTLIDQSIEIDLSKQPNGIYFLKVENGGMEWNKKVVKN